MALRITNRMMAERSMLNLNATLRRLDRHNDQLSTGKRFSLPSHDPSGVEVSMRLRSTIFETEQFTDNVDAGIAWLNTTDAALNQINQVLLRAQELVTYGANGSNPQDAREAMALEMDQLIEDLIDVGNTRHGNKFIFAGQNTLTAPFAAVSDPADVVLNPDGLPIGANPITAVSYNGTSLDPTDPTTGLNVEIGPGITQRISIHGDGVLEKVFEALITARDHLWEGDVEALSEADLALVSESVDQVLKARAEAGARVNRLELVRDRLSHTKIDLTRLLSETEDVDVAETIMQLKMEETVYRASLASGARIIMPTLLDFLR